MNLQPDAQIQTVRRETPQYLRTQSLQSSFATNEYFSDNASDAASEESDDTKASYETPPSRISTPVIEQNQADSEMTLPARPGVVQPAPLDIRHGQSEAQSTVRMLSNFDDMSPPTSEVDDTPYIRFAIEQLTRDEDVLGRGRHSTTTPEEPAFGFSPVEPESPRSFSTPTPSPPPPTPPQQPPTPRPQSHIQRKPVPEEVMVPVDLSKDLRSRLGFVPIPLRLPIIASYLLLCLLMIAGLLFSLLFVSSNHALYDYDGNATPRYFVFQYLPQLLGIMLVIWLFVIEAAVYRSLPYFRMGPKYRRYSVLQDLRILPSNYLLPDLTFFKNGEPMLGLTFLVFWLSSFTVPLLSCLYETQWITDDGPARFRWTTVRGVGWTLFALYTLLCAGIVYCMVRFRTRNSNLLWDPCSLADLICLFRRSNVCHDFEQTEVSPEPNGRVLPQTLRLGFWTTTERSDVFHGVGEEYAPIKRFSLQRPQPTQKPSEGLLHPNDAMDLETQQRHSYGSAFSRNIHSPFVRYRWVPWYLRDSAVLAWIIAAILLLIAFLVVSFVNNAVERGFEPLLTSRTDSHGFSPADFLYSFLPSFLGMVLFLAWQPIAMYFRAVQPFCNLSQPTGTDASHSLLLCYPAQGPIGVVVRSLRNGDYRVSYVSFISILALSIPVLAGGVFTAQFFTAENEVRMVASMPGFIALCVLVSIYALSYLIIWPTRKRYLPHNINTIAGLMSWLYASPLMADGAFQNVGTRAELVERLTASSSTPATLTGDPGTAKLGEKNQAARHQRRADRGSGPRYAFGVYIGRDGKEHLGIDRLQRPGSREMLVVPSSR
ncbi:hypothetical protein A1O1_00089 [Capronia coronata CBS 617.96]|uniref:Phosphoribosylaminoimidazole-succinocarboxamide synthase n=1 Tax=Capronia coronata CBS 617.96 TaxID=1182541 RepID=W9Z086_9EURO|nr:uncharacterized protein A1O1_00089 [Capronia coronata CBS 617.96]EXJ94971.1 hypothetical protein A1O1_00089 [Capronia coronata CBS 617.96]